MRTGSGELWRRLFEELPQHAQSGGSAARPRHPAPGGRWCVAGLGGGARHRTAASDHPATAARTGGTDPRLPARAAAVDRIPGRHTRRPRATAGGPGRGPRPGRDTPCSPIWESRRSTAFAVFEEALVTEGQEYNVIPLPASRGGTLLARLQADIRAARQPGDGNTATALEPDRSIRVHRCHSARREVEVLRDELLDAFDELPGLAASDVLILAPDLDIYGPLAEAILLEGDPSLPLRLAERRLDRSDPLVQGLRALLHLASGRAPLSEGLALLELPAVAASLESTGADPDMLAHRLRAAGITWGLDAAHRQTLNAGGLGTGTWPCRSGPTAGRSLAGRRPRRDRRRARAGPAGLWRSESRPGGDERGAGLAGRPAAAARSLAGRGQPGTVGGASGPGAGRGAGRCGRTVRLVGRDRHRRPVARRRAGPWVHRPVGGVRRGRLARSGGPGRDSRGVPGGRRHRHGRIQADARHPLPHSGGDGST